MGSGSSKEKDVPKPRADKVSKSSKQLDLKVGNDEEKRLKKEIEVVNTGSKTNYVTSGQTSPFRKTEVTKPSTNTNGRSQQTNGRVGKVEAVKNLGGFESDSESEGEDISAVLEATKNEYNTNLKNQQFSDRDSSLPETYAQRLQREQYRHQPEGLMRQKTIYRNPDEWEVDENEMENFDVSKFKQVNVREKNSEQKSMLDRDIFSPNVQESRGFEKREGENTLLMERKESLPHYDTSEEALLAEIEKEFDL